MPVKVHMNHLVAKRQQLQAHCAWEREQVVRIGYQIEQRLAAIDRMIGGVKSAFGKPILLIAAAGGILLIGRWRVLRWLSKGFMWFAVAQRMRRAFAR